MTIERRDIAMPHTFRIPLGPWKPVGAGAVLFEAEVNPISHKKVTLTKVTAEGNDKIRVELYFVDIPYDIAEGQRVNLGHFESRIFGQEDINRLFKKPWGSGKLLRGYQLRCN